MPTSESDLKKIAALACIEMDKESTIQLVQDMNAIMNFVEQLRSIDTTHITPLLHPLDLQQRLRNDEITEVDCSSQLAKMAPLFTDNLYLVPKVIEIGKQTDA